MTYNCLLALNKCYVETRMPEEIKDKLIIFFSGVKDGLTAIFKNSKGITYYKDLKDARCELSKSFLDGEISVILTDFKDENIKCEALSVIHCGENILVFPLGYDLEKEINKIYTLIDVDRQRQEELLKRLFTAEAKLAEYEEHGVPLICE